ncbi:uncharacterized protein LOC113125542 [Mastacembelus armatus]|uniref:uncharacterized protein LOC113125542 n=1 Tax=Mastacembelus armatus TaxID=205130 RepID=UPI000E459411|nr:uncharacterized protein LOC113125542 [Mastacembelus armatus]
MSPVRWCQVAAVLLLLLVGVPFTVLLLFPAHGSVLVDRRQLDLRKLTTGTRTTVSTTVDRRQQEVHRPSTAQHAVTRWAVTRRAASSRAAVQRNLTAELGQTLTLPCQVPANNNIVAVMWTRPDQKPKHVLFLHGGQRDLNNQHPSFRNRVELVSRQLKDGNLSLILRNFKTGDSGKYECRYKERRGGVFVLSESVSTINLTAKRSGDPAGNRSRGHDAVLITLSVIGAFVLLAVAVVCFVLCRKCKRRGEQS